MPSTTCPHCQTPSQITYFPTSSGNRDALFIWLGESVARLVDSNFILPLAYQFDLEDKRWRLGRCENCLKPVFLILDAGEQSILAIYPPYAGKPDPDISKKQVGEDYVEARLCFRVGAFKGAAVLCRRALQGAAIDKGSKKDKLVDQLDELAASGELTIKLAQLAHSVRVLSNYGAHPGEDGLDDLTSAEAEALCALTWQILEHLYVVPAASARIEEVIQTKKARSKGAPASKSSNP